jgi:ketosteroid isomerase-like protein
MSQANVEVVGEAYNAYNREGMSAVLVYLAPDIVWRNPADSPIAGVFIGHQGVLEFQRQTDEVWEAMEFAPERIDELPDGRILAVVRFRFRARASKIEAEVPFAHVMTIADGKATEVTLYTSEAEALKAVGLAE